MMTMNQFIQRINVTTLLLLAATLTATAEVNELAHYNLHGASGSRDAAAPEIWKSQMPGGPDLARQGSPKIAGNVPDSRRQVSGAAIKLEDPDQCYSMAKNLVSGDNFVLEAWACALKDDDHSGNGFHSVVANGNGGTGFLLAQNDDQWAVLVGGVGSVSLGPVQPGTWTQLAIVKNQGQVTGWLNGEKVADLPELGGGAENFSIGATAPGKESFSGLVSEVRYASFDPGLFDPAADFLPGAKQHIIIPVKTAASTPPDARRVPSWAFETRDARFGIDDRGFIVSLASRQAGQEYSPAGHPSPLLSLHEFKQPNDLLIFPTTAAFDQGKQEFTLKYPNGATAVVSIGAKDEYFRCQLVSLTPRGDVDNIVWGPLHTTVSGKMGDIIGVVRNDDWAIGMLGLDDNTIAGPPVDGDCYGMGYYIHSPDPTKYPVPPKYKEGQWFNIGGNGVSDTAFYSHPEEYFQQVFGTGAKLEPEFGSTVAYHSRDRRRSYTYFWSLLPGFQRSRPRHQVSDPVAADFIGSAVALYACPDEQGLATIGKIILAENLPHPMMDGKWVRDPAGFKPDIAWGGPHDKFVEYATALGLKGCQDEGQGEYYANPADHWQGKRVGFADGRSLTYKEFTDSAKEVKYGLHTLCLFLQGGRCTDVTPVPSEHLQMVCRTKLAKDISPADTEIIVTDPSFLAEPGTWPNGDDGNYLRIGGEMLKYDGISDTAPFTLKGVKRGHASPAVAHKAGDEVVKLQQNCYNGFVPDMKLMLDYADYYAKVCAENGMEYIDFDGYESLMYQNHGYYAMQVFNHRLFDTYARLTGGKALRVMGSCVFGGAWKYMSVCNVGGGNNMFDPVNNRWGIEGKDIRNGFANSYFPATFGIQGWHSDWSLYDAENLEAKSIGWNATYMLGLNQGAVENCGEKAAIFKAFRAWENARAANVFTPALKQRLMDLDSKFHLEQTGEKTFVISPVKEVRISASAGNDAKQISLGNSQAAQPWQFALQVDAAVNGCVITLPDGSQLKADQKIDKGQFILCQGNNACIADHNRKKIAALALPRAATLPQGKSKLGVQFMVDSGTNIRFTLTIWMFGKSAEALATKN